LVLLEIDIAMQNTLPRLEVGAIASGSGLFRRSQRGNIHI
jgi:hypothetical protein